MKFFTRSWANGDMDDAECRAVSVRYKDHLDAILPVLPDAVGRLATAINVHDGLIRRACFEAGSRTFALALRCGDLQVGNFDLDLTYSHAELCPGDLAQLREVASDAGAEALYDEVDMGGDATYIHRVLFWPSAEIEVTFRELTLRITPRPDREVTREGFVELGSSAG